MNPGFPDILAMPPDMRYTIGRQKEISNIHTEQRKAPEVTTPGLFLSFGSRQIKPEDGYQLSFLSIHLQM